MTKHVSIIIRTLNEASNLKILFQAIKQQIHPFQLQLMVVDSGSTDETLDFLIEEKIFFVSIPRECFTFGRALNLGIRSLNIVPDLIVSISAHCIPSHSSWLLNLVSPILADPAVLTTGYQYSYPLSRSSEVNWFIYRPHINSRINPAFIFNNANSAFSYILWKLHSFDSYIPAQEDIEFADYHFRNNNAKILLLPDASITHIHNFTNIELFRRIYVETCQECLLSSCPLRVFILKILGSILAIPSDFRLAYQRGRIIKAIPGILAFRSIEIVSIALGTANSCLRLFLKVLNH